MKGSVIRELLALTQKPEIISFAGGLPDPTMFPVEQFNECMSHVIKTIPSVVFQYGETPGYKPLREIVANAGKEGAVVVQKVREGKGDFGYNARTDVYENLHAAGVVDPAKVARVALENAASIAGMFLTTECVIVEKKEDKPEMPMGAPGMGGMGGMM